MAPTMPATNTVLVRGGAGTTSGRRVVSRGPTPMTRRIRRSGVFCVAAPKESDTLSSRPAPSSLSLDSAELEILPPASSRPTMPSSPKRATSTPVHVHFGAGKLGLGLVVPAVSESSTRFVVLQRPSADWATLADRHPDTVPLLVNGEEAVEGGLKLITQVDIDAAAAEGKSVLDLVLASSEGRGHLLLTSDPAVGAALAAGATSFSCALGGVINQVLQPLLGELPFRRNGARPTLYACENDLDSVKELAGALKRRVDVVPCMVDRICSSREVVADDGQPRIEVEAENHPGQIVLLEETSQDLDELPLDGDTVQVPETEEVADYLFVQKKRLVNSMHTVLAFSTLVDHDANRDSLFHWEQALPELPLLNYAEAPVEVQDRIWAWAVAQILVLMKEQGVDLMTEANESSSEDDLVQHMLEVARTTLERFSSIEDTTTRVLGGGVSNRYNERLVPVQEGMHLVEAMLSDLPIDSIQRKVLAAADLDITTVVEACDTLVAEATKFAVLDEEERAAQAEWDDMTAGLRGALSNVFGGLQGTLSSAAFAIGGGAAAVASQASPDKLV